ncbi:hypothetical protein AB0J86_03010 [Micromonospora sp. NPDC049559]|uniref:hypothetical protein n=1 Tax=Micromonospora sp. NPDC049559 TaxID=3155923 RepID=UPI00344749E4
MNELNDRLADLADEMTDTDYTALRGRVETTARRIGQRRVAGTTAAALALVGLLGIGGLQLAPQGQRHPLPPAASQTASEPPTPAPTTPAATTTPSAPASPTGSAPANAALSHVPGRLVYLRVGAEIEVVTVTDGVARTTSFGPRKLGDQVATVAPDGSRVALVRPAKDVSEYPGDLVVVQPGGARKVVRQGVSWGGGTGPAWMPDSRRLLVGVTTLEGDVATGESYGYVDAVTGRYDKLGITAFPSYLSWSANGAYRVHADGDSLVVARPDGTRVRKVSVAGQPECDRTGECPSSVQAVSDDGRYVATGLGSGDPTRVTRARFVLDTVSGKRIDLPSKLRGGVEEIFFRPDDTLVVQTSDHLYLVGLDGTVTATIERPESTNQADLAAYRR